MANLPIFTFILIILYVELYIEYVTFRQLIFFIALRVYSKFITPFTCIVYLHLAI